MIKAYTLSQFRSDKDECRPTRNKTIVFCISFLRRLTFLFVKLKHVFSYLLQQEILVGPDMENTADGAIRSQVIDCSCCSHLAQSSCNMHRLRCSYGMYGI